MLIFLRFFLSPFNKVFLSHFIRTIISLPLRSIDCCASLTAVSKLRYWRHLEEGEASAKRYLMTDADKERSPKDESKSLLCICGDAILSFLSGPRGFIILGESGGTIPSDRALGQRSRLYQLAEWFGLLQPCCRTRSLFLFCLIIHPKGNNRSVRIRTTLHIIISTHARARKHIPAVRKQK